MTSTAARPLGDSPSGSTTFSYAQAAKGRATSTVQSSQAPSGANTPPKDTSSATDVLSGNVSSIVGAEQERSGSVNGETNMKAASNGSELDPKSTPLVSARSFPSSPSVGTASTSTLPKEDETSFTPRLASESSWDRLTQTETSGDRSMEGDDRKKGKKGKKDKTTEKEEETDKDDAKPDVLVAAPPPAVNFWQQRIEAQAAKAKASPQSVESFLSNTDDSMPNGTHLASTSKSFDVRKKLKSGLEETERSAGLGQIVSIKDQPNYAKPQRKGSEANSRPKEDLSGKRSAPRGSRTGDREEKPAMKNLPPPVEDAVSWPTPDTALEEKRKTQERVEKEDKEEVTSNKPRPKEKWVTVPYIPTVTFNTPLPARGRGGRGGGGSRGGAGRGAHGANGSISGDKTFASGTAANNIGTEPRERGRDNVSVGRATSLPPNSSNRSIGDSTYSSRDQRKPSVSTFDKSKTEHPGPAPKSEAYAAAGHRRTSFATQTESPFTSHHDSRPSLIDNAKTNRQDSPNMAAADNQFQSKSSGTEPRSDPNLRLNDLQRESNGSGQIRDRGEGRPERGRGAYRGRGSHAANFQNGQPHSQHSFTNGHPTQLQNTYAIRQNSGPYSPPLQQQQQQYTAAYPNPGRAGRAGPPRSQSIPNSNAMYGRFSPTVTSSQQISPLQTVSQVFDYQGLQSMSAVPYNPYMEQYSVLAMVTMQLEYYFSIDNLCKDVFLRKHMDSKGFVFLSTIANFKRIQSLTQDFELLRFACQESDIIDIVVGEDGIDRLRRADGWEKWVLALEERDEIAKNDGPERYYRQQMQSRPQPMAPRIISQSHSSISPTAFTANGAEPNFRPFASVLPGPNGADQPTVYQNESPLSAAVPDFSPNPASSMLNDLEAETTFTDEEVDNLQLVYNHKPPGESKPKSPPHSASSRTFSNGSIDGRSVTEEILELHRRQSRTVTNGDSPHSETSPESLRRARSPFTLSPTKPVFGNAPPVMWVKGQRDQAPVTEANKNEPYNVVRARALRHRESSAGGETDGDMKLLYQFWSHFLVRNFNPRMYEEFRNCAIDDARIRQNMFGMTNLIQYYDEVLNSKKKTIPEILARHYVEIVNSEDRFADRPGLTKLRAAWRNGALDMKSRKKVDNFVDPRLREELER